MMPTRLYEICRAEPQSGLVARLEALLRAALAVYVWTDRALEMVEALQPFEQAGLERCRQAVRIAAARRCSPLREEQVLDDVARWSERSEDPQARPSFAGWLGRLRYRQGRFEEAAELQEHAAAGAGWTTARIAAQLNGASAWMEAFQHERARALLQTALALARACRHTLYETRAEWLLRATAYRLGLAGAPDVELLDAAALAGVSEMEGFICLNEAAVAWRAGSVDGARALAERARRILAELGEPWACLLAACLAAACGASASNQEIAALVERAQGCPLPRVRAQALGLLTDAGWRPPAWGEEVLAALVAAVPEPYRAFRCEVLSMKEAIERLVRATTLDAGSSR